MAPPSSQLDVVVRNTLVEAFTIHIRQLVEFFWDDRRPNATLKGAYAADYFEPGEWKRLRPGRPQRLNRPLTGKVGWGVAHLTYDRARSTLLDKQWEAAHMCAALAPTVRLFIDNVDSSKFDRPLFDQIGPCVDRFDAKYGSVTP